MNYKFNKEFLQDLNQSGKISWLEQNEKGAYSSSTLVGMNTSREHGLYCIPYHDGTNKINLLAKLEESVFVDQHLCEISTNRYAENIFPNGYKYLESVQINPLPEFIFRIGDQRLKKTVFLLSDKNILVVRYELCDQGRPMSLVIKPFLSFRANNELLTNIRGFNTDSYKGDNFVRWAPRAKLTGLNVLFTKGEYVSSTFWYHKFLYPDDIQRYKSNTEDLFNPGFLKVALQPYETMELYFSSEEIGHLSFNYEKLYRKECIHRENNISPEFTSEPLRMVISAALKRGRIDIEQKETFSLSNWKSQISMREFLFSIPGLYFATSRNNDIEAIFDRLLQSLDHGILPENYSGAENQRIYKSPDLSLWLIILIFYYLKITGRVEFLSKDRLEIIRQIIDLYNKGTNLNIHADEDGLLFCGEKDLDMSWLTCFNPQTPEMGFGKLLHLNALWYSALMVMHELYSMQEKKRIAKKYIKMAESARASFMEKFVNVDHSRFNEKVSGNNHSKVLTISQILPFALPFNPLDEELREPFFLNLVRLLVTSAGIHPHVNEDEEEQVGKPVWPWANMFYFMALKNMGISAKLIDERFKMYQEKIELFLKSGILGAIPETAIIDELKIDYPGAPDYTLSTAGYLWIHYIVSESGAESGFEKSA